MKLIAAACAAALVLSATGALAISAANKCAAAKVSTAGKYEFCRLKVAAKAIKTGTPPDYTKCDAALSAKWASIESAGGMSCPTSGDVTAQQDELIDDSGRTTLELGGQPRFTDNHDGTITDSQSGLTWEKKIKLDSTVDAANLHDADDIYRWAGQCSINTSKYCQPTAAAATACTAGVEGNASGCAQCTGGDGTCNASDTVWTWLVALNAASFAGHNDWRLPRRTELAALIDYTAPAFPAVDEALSGDDCGAACTDLTSADCSCTAYDGYWSASTSAPFANSAWFVFFGDGYVYPLGKTSTYSVRAVR